MIASEVLIKGWNFGLEVYTDFVLEVVSYVHQSVHLMTIAAIVKTIIKVMRVD